MELIINLDSINDPLKKEWLINTLKLMNITYHTTDKAVTLDVYKLDVEEDDQEITRENL